MQRKREKLNLTKETVLETTPNSTIYRGYGEIRNHWNADLKQRIKFIVYRGTVPDWCVYYTQELDNSWGEIEEYGDKIHSQIDLKMIINYDEETYKLYRD